MTRLAGATCHGIAKCKHNALERVKHEILANERAAHKVLQVSTSLNTGNTQVKV